MCMCSVYSIYLYSLYTWFCLCLSKALSVFCPCFVAVSARSCQHPILVSSLLHYGFFLMTSWSCPANIPVSTWIHPDFDMVTSWSCLDYIVVPSWLDPGLVLITSWSPPGYFLVTSSHALVTSLFSNGFILVLSQLYPSLILVHDF